MGSGGWPSAVYAILWLDMTFLDLGAHALAFVALLGASAVVARFRAF